MADENALESAKLWKKQLINYFTLECSDYFSNLFRQSLEHTLRTNKNEKQVQNNLYRNFQEICKNVQDWPLQMIEDATAKFDTKFSGNAKRLAEKALVANCYMYAIMRSGKVKLAKPDINLNKIVHRMYAKVACDVAFKQPHLFDTTIKNANRSVNYTLQLKTIEDHVQMVLDEMTPVVELLRSERDEPGPIKKTRAVAKSRRTDISEKDDEKEESNPLGVNFKKAELTKKEEENNELKNMLNMMKLRLNEDHQKYQKFYQESEEKDRKIKLLENTLESLNPLLQKCTEEVKLRSHKREQRKIEKERRRSAEKEMNQRHIEDHDAGRKSLGSWMDNINSDREITINSNTLPSTYYQSAPIEDNEREEEEEEEEDEDDENLGDYSMNSNDSNPFN